MNEFLSDFLYICNKHSDSIAVYCVLNSKKTVGITYSELNRLSNELSFFFVKIFDRNFQYVGVSLCDYFLLPCILLAIWKSGHSFAGAGNQYLLKDTVNYLNTLGVKYMITDKSNCEYDCEMISTFYVNQIKFFIWRRNVEAKQKLVEICYGIMTSGTTGSSKIIQVPWACILSNVIELSEEFHITASDCIFQNAPYTFDPFFVELFISFLNGCSLVIVSEVLKLSSSALLKILFEEDIVQSSIDFSINTEDLKKNNVFLLSEIITRVKPITILQMTPSLFKRWSKHEIQEFILSDKTSLRVLILGGERFPKEILKFKQKSNNTRIYNIYGITEISCWTFLNEVTHESGDNEISLGKVLKNITYKISNTNELIIGSSSRVCYVDNEKHLDDTVIFRNTGDIVDDINGRLFFQRRIDQVIKKFGIKINIRNIEEIFLSQNPSITDCFCVFDHDASKLGLFYLCDTHLGETKPVTYEYFVCKGFNYPKELLKASEHPDYLMEMSELPLNSHGKFNKTKLLHLLRDVSLQKKNIRSHMEIKNKFQNIWNDILGLKKSDLSTSFINLGGNSILALQLINKLEDAGINVPTDFIVVLLNEGNKERCLECLSYGSTSYIPRKKLKIDEELKANTKVSLCVKWKFDLRKCVDASPILFTYQGNDRLIVGSHSSKLTCIDLKSGQDIWTVHLADRIESGCVVTKDGSRGYVGCYDSHVYCIDTSNGNCCWKYRTGDMVKSTPCLSSNENTVFVASYDRHLYCLSAKDGRLIKKIRVSDKGIYSNGLINIPLNMYYIASLDGTCLALCQTSCDIKWKKKLESPIFASPCLLQEDRIIFAEVIGIVYCLNSYNGDFIWRYSVKNFIYSSPISYQWEGANYIYFGCNDGHLYCLKDSDDVEFKWQSQLDSSVFARPTVFVIGSHKKICAVSTKGFIYVCDLMLGSIEYKFDLSGEVFSSPSIKENELFLGCRDNCVYALKILLNE